MRAEGTFELGLGGGLLVADQEAERDGKPIDRRIEEWVVSNLEGKPCKSAETLWDQMVGTNPGLRRLSRKDERQAAKDGDWGRFRLADRRGVAAIRLTDANLIKDSIIEELVDDLLGLIQAGYHRIVVNFEEVERLSSQIVVGLAEAHRRCERAHGGRLRVCGLRPEVASALAITGIEHQIETHPDEPSALSAPWPAPDALRPLPVTILSALKLYREPDGPSPLAERGVPPMPTETLAETYLIIQSGRAEGRGVPIRGARLTIGRQEGCGIRVCAPTVSRVHASVELRDGRCWLRDLDSTNGTHVNGDVISSNEVEVRHGDRIAIGPLRFRVDSRPVTGPPAEVDGQVIDWLKPDDAEAWPTLDSREITLDDLPMPDSARPDHARAVSTEVIQDILVITPLQSHLDDEAQIGPVRVELQSLAERHLPRRVIVNLQHVAHLSSGAIGVLVAHALKLDREGGELRLSGVAPRVMAVLNQVRLPMLIEVHPTKDEAVLCAWRRPTGVAG